jgi:ATP-dependent DNA helicase RecQ
MVIKSIVNKSGLKVYIIQSTDRKLPLEDIASAKGLDMPKLISEMENIVYSGTKVDINYYLDDILEIEQQDEIFDYFKDDAETDSIEEAMDEFEEEYDEEELRLMRIKFLSEFAN